MKYTILIIGSNSFAGSNFCNHLLDKNVNVIGVSRSKEIIDLVNFNLLFSFIHINFENNLNLNQSNYHLSYKLDKPDYYKVA